MSFASVWRGWRAKVHDILEVGDGNPIGRVVNVFLIVLIIANGLAFVAETVSSVYERWARSSRRSTSSPCSPSPSNMCSGCGVRSKSLCFAACRIGAHG